MTLPSHIPIAKITPPRIGVPLLQRARLIGEVRDGMTHRLLLLSAEAGYGKTSLLLSALPDAGLPVAWLTLDESDADPHLFSAALVAAVRTVVPDFGAKALDILTAGPDLTELRRALFTGLDALPETVIVLDDFHTIERHPEVVRLVDDLLATLPPSLHLVIATRTWPLLQILPRLVVQGQAVAIDSAHLKFSDEEVSAFFRSSHGLEIAGPVLERLAERTEGWPAALQLIALSARTRGLADTGATPPELYAYLATTVLDGLDPATRNFLVRTSILSELWPSICQVVAPDVDAGTTLAAIERRKLFLYRLDDAGPRYRYHQLFAEFLSQRLREEQSTDAVAALHTAAAQRLESEGSPDQAVRHYFAAGALGEAERVMTPLHGDRLSARLAYTFRDLVMRLPEDIQQRYPWITRCGASAARFVGDYELGLTLARRALAAAEGRDPDLWTFSIHGVGVMLGHLDRPDEAAALCETALQSIQPNVEPRLRGGVISDLIDAYVHLGRIQDAARLLPSLEQIVLEGTQPGKSYGLAYFAGELAAARMEYAQAVEHFAIAARVGKERGSLTVQMWALLGILRADLARHNLSAAREVLARARHLHEDTGERASDLAFMHLTGDVHLLAGELDSAEDHYRRTLAAVREGESQEPRVWAQLGMAGAARAREHFAEAESLLLESADLCARAHLIKLLPLMRFEHLSLLMEIGRRDDARATLPGLRDTMRQWASDPGEARCDLIEAHLSQAAVAQDGLTPAAAGALRRVLSLPPVVMDEVLPFLRAESLWTVPLLIAGLRAHMDPERTQALLLEIGGPAVDHLVPLLSDRVMRGRAITMLAAIGDPRARRPLARLAAQRGTPTREAAQQAILRLREPEPITLEIGLLGPFVVKRNGSPVGELEWKTQKVKTLFKYLILHRHRGVPPEELIDVLWPDAAPETGAVRLKTAVKTLRQILEPLLEGTRSTFIIRGADTLRFTGGERCRLDLEEYDRFVAAGRAEEEAGRIPEALAALDHAAVLYRGDLLEEDRYEEWAAAQREGRRERHVEVLDSLADLHARRRDFRRAIEAAQGVLMLDRLRESAYRRIMRYAMARGDRETALRTYQTCERLLREELGVPPQPETLALLDQAKAAAPA